MRFIVFQLIYADVGLGRYAKSKSGPTQHAKEKATRETKPHEENISADMVDLIADVSEK
jgi:hypothetical protein